MWRVESEELSKAVLDKFHHNRLCKGPLTTHHSLLTNKKTAFTLAEGATHVETCNNNRKAAFTLAEVLITLGIIGVVAALTMPTLIQNHRKQEVVTKLKHASSVLGQAYNMSIADYGDAAINREGFEANNPDTALEMFNKYYVHYIKFLKVEKTEKGVLGYLSNGSVIYFRRNLWNGNDNWGNTYVFVCMNKKACLDINEESNDAPKYVPNGKTVFLLYSTGNPPDYIISRSTHEQRVEECKNLNGGGESCTALIFEAGWKIPDDYPIRF